MRMSASALAACAPTLKNRVLQPTTMAATAIPIARNATLKIRIALELQEQDDVPQIELMMPRILDNFQVYLRELRIEDLKGSAGMYRLREELLSRVAAAVAPARVNDVLFKEMLVQ